MKSTYRNLLIKATPLSLVALILITVPTLLTTSNQEEINQLEEIIEIQSLKIQAIQTKIENNETESVSIVSNNLDTISGNVDDFSNPSYDSGWIPIEPGDVITLTHNQGIHIFVHVLGWDYLDDGSFVVHQNIAGNGYWDTPSGVSCGISWCCSNENQITPHLSNHILVALMLGFLG